MPSSPARIALMLPRFGRYGGVEQFGFRLAGELTARGHSVDFICARQEAPPPANVRVLCTGRPFGPRWLKMLVFALRAEAMRKAGQYDCSVGLGKTLHQDIACIGGGPLQVFWRLSGDAWPPGLSRICKQLMRRLQPANWLTLAIEKRLFSRTPYIVAVSDTVRNWILEVYPHLARSSAAPQTQKLLTIYDCPDTSCFFAPSPEEKEAARRRLVPDHDAYIIGVATTNFALKGVGQLIRSLTRMPDVHLCVAGGRNPGRYERLARKLGVAARVHFCGKVDDMRTFYHGLDLFILPTFYDTLGNVVLEALACGLKVICSDRAGAMIFLPEKRILRHPDSPDAIAALIRQTRDDTDTAPIAVSVTAGIVAYADLVEKVLHTKRTETDA